MKKTKTPPLKRELPSSLLIVEEDDYGSHDLLDDITSNTTSAKVKMLINRWEDVISEHTKTWDKKQWESVSTEEVWEQITSRIKAVKEVQFIHQRNYDGTIRQYILYEDHMFETGNLGREGWEDMDVQPNHMGRLTTPHKRTVLPIMLKALINVAVKQYNDHQTLIPFTATLANILSEHSGAGAFVESCMADLLQTIPKMSAGNALKTLQDFLPFEMVQPFWIKMGVEYAQAAWINIGVEKNDIEGTRTFFATVVNLPQKYNSPKHVETIGSILFGKKVIHNAKSMGYGFCPTLEKLLQLAPVDIKLFEKWCSKPSDTLAANILTVVGSDEIFAPYTKVVLDQCSPQARHTFVRQLVVQNDTKGLKAVAQKYIQESCEVHLKDGDLHFVNILMTATNLQLNEEHWDMYWNMMENEYPSLGRGLRAMMEKKMMSAAIVPTAHSITKRKM